MFKAKQAMIGSLMAAVAGMASGSPASSQTGLATAPFVTTQKADEHNAGALVGRNIVNDAGEIIGNVNFLLMNDQGQITTVTIGVGGFLGVGEKNVGVPFSALKISDDGNGNRVVKLAATKAQIDIAPKFVWLETPMSVRVEEAVKTAADKVSTTAKSAAEKASEAMKGEPKPPAN